MLDNKINIDEIVSKLNKDEAFKPYEITCELAEDKIVFHIGRVMSLEEKSIFVSKVANACFVDDEYHPENFDVVFAVMLMQMLTDLPVFETEDEKGNKIIDIDKTYALYNALKVEDRYYSLTTSDCTDTLADLRWSAKEAVEFKKDRIIANEKKQIDILKKEVEDGIALLNSTADTLKEQGEKILNSDEFKDISALADKTKNISEEEVIKVLNEKNK